VTVYTVPGVVTRVIDGDTVVADLDLGWGVWMRDRHIRLAGINCPEMSTPEGTSARIFTINWLNRLMPVGDDGPLKAPVTVVSHGIDKYGRVLGTVSHGAADLNDELLSSGNAVVMK
jgi:endonuclease YncB( thermonuclease family)